MKLLNLKVTKVFSIIVSLILVLQRAEEDPSLDLIKLKPIFLLRQARLQ